MKERVILGLIVFSLIFLVGASSCGSTYNYGTNPVTTPTAPSTVVSSPVATAPVTPPAANAVSVQTITIGGYAFIPADVTIKAGDTITWKNEDPVTHQVISDAGLFDSGGMFKGEAIPEHL